MAGSGRSRSEPTRTEMTIVVATKDLPLGSTILADAVREDTIDIGTSPRTGSADLARHRPDRPPERHERASHHHRRSSAGGSGTIQNIELPAGLVGMAVQVDQVSGVGTLTKPGDHVDMVVALTGEVFPVVTVNPDDDSITTGGGHQRHVHQGAAPGDAGRGRCFRRRPPRTGHPRPAADRQQKPRSTASSRSSSSRPPPLGTLLPPPPADTGNNAEAPATDETALTGQQQIVILAVTAQQAEVIKYSQGQASISLVLRSADDFRDPTTKEPLPPETIIPVTTTGITLKTLVDDYGVLIPELVEAVLPEDVPAP